MNSGPKLVKDVSSRLGVLREDIFHSQSRLRQTNVSTYFLCGAIFFTTEKSQILEAVSNLTPVLLRPYALSPVLHNDQHTAQDQYPL